MSIRTEAQIQEHTDQIEALKGGLAALADRITRLEKKDPRKPIKAPTFPRNLKIRGFVPPESREARGP